MQQLLPPDKKQRRIFSEWFVYMQTERRVYAALDHIRWRSFSLFWFGKQTKLLVWWGQKKPRKYALNVFELCTGNGVVISDRIELDFSLHFNFLIPLSNVITPIFSCQSDAVNKKVHRAHGSCPKNLKLVDSQFLESGFVLRVQS